MSIYRVTGETEGGVPVLSAEHGYKPCSRTRLGVQMRARAVMRATKLVCPACDRLCELPASIGQGNEFVMCRGSGTHRDADKPSRLQASLQAQCDVWNVRHPVGTAVSVRLAGGGAMQTVTASRAYVLNGLQAVIMLDGIRNYRDLCSIRAIV